MKYTAGAQDQGLRKIRGLDCTSPNDNFEDRYLLNVPGDGDWITWQFVLPR